MHRTFDVMSPLIPHDLPSWLTLFSFSGVGAFAGWAISRAGSPRLEQPTDDSLLRHFENAHRNSTDGVLICDASGAITSANDAFLKLTGEDRTALLQRKIRELPWNWADQESLESFSEPVPWIQAIRDGRERCGRLFGPNGSNNLTLLLRAVPIRLDGDHPRGALCFLQDVTRLQKKEIETQALLKTIRDSSLQIRQQNAEIDELLVRDPITGCLNRRTGLEALERLWETARRHDEPLGCAMISIDHIRKINEEYGRITAQKILREVASCLRDNCRSSDVLFRSGGEELLCLMPQTRLVDASLIAERMRQSVARLQSCDTAVTISLGVAVSDSKQHHPQDLVDLAERRLRTAKNRGRNQVVQEEISFIKPIQEANDRPEPTPPISAVIPFPAVSALMSALAYRDPATAAHSRRVADLSVAIGQRLMSLRSSYLLEMAALLHDIGKIGVADSILHKQSSLTSEERAEIQLHRRMGLEIVRAAFGSSELTSILENYGIPFTNSDQQRVPLPLGARILAVADAYDSMVTAQTYRQPLSHSETIEELQRCAGAQFDPEIVNQLIEVFKTRYKEVPPTFEIDRDVAFALGMHLECLVDAVDRQDFEALEGTAQRLMQISHQSSMTEITELADELTRMMAGKSDQLGILQNANELINCCRAARSAILVNVSARDSASTVEQRATFPGDPHGPFLQASVHGAESDLPTEFGDTIGP